MKLNLLEAFLKYKNSHISMDFATKQVHIDLNSIRKDLKDKYLALKSGELVSRQTESVSCISITYDSKHLAAGCSNIVYLFSIEERSLLAELSGHEDLVGCITVSRDNRYFISGSWDSNVILWNIANRSIEAELKGHSSAVTCITTTPDNCYIISGSADFNCIIWNIEARNIETVLTGHNDIVNSISVTKDNRFLISASSDSTLILWDLDTKTQAEVFEGHTSFIVSVAVTSDSRILVSGSFDKTLRIWNLQDRCLESVLSGHTDFINCLAITHDDKYIVSGSSDHTIRLWNIEEKRLESVLEGHKHYVTCLTVTYDNAFVVSGSWDKTVRIWNIEKRLQEAVLEGHTLYVNCITVTYNGKYILTGSDDQSLRIYPLHDRPKEIILEGQSSKVEQLELSRDGKKVICGSWDKLVRVWNLTEVKCEGVLKGHANPLTCLLISHHGRYIISGSSDSTIIVWNSEDSTQIGVLDGHDDSVKCMATSIDDRFLVSGSDDSNIIVWNLNRFKEEYTLQGHTQSINSLLVNKSFTLCISASDDRTIRIWSLDMKTQESILEGHKESVRSLIMTNDEKYIISGCRDGEIRVWSIADKNSVSSLLGHSNLVKCLAVTQDGGYLISGSRDCTIRIWNLKDMYCIAVLEGHTDLVKCIVLTSDDKYIISGSFDCSIKIWNLKEHYLEAELMGHNDVINCISLSQNNRFIYSGSDDKTVRIWDSVEYFNNSSYTYLKDAPIQIFGTRFNFRMLTFIDHVLNITSPILHEEWMNDIVISPYRINILHFYAYFNQHSKLKQGLNMGCRFIQNVRGESPLTVSLNRNTRKCIDAILKFMIKMHGKNDESLCLYLKVVSKDVPDIIIKGSKHLSAFMGILFSEAKQSDLPSFAIPKAKLPLYIYHSSMKISPNSFILPESASQSQLLIQFHVSKLPWNFENGSRESLKFLKALMSCSDMEIYRSPLVIALTQIKWTSLWPAICILSFLNWSNLIMIVLISFDISGNLGLKIVFLILNICFILYEGFQAVASRWLYFTDLWNFVDIGKSILSIIWICLEISNLRFTELTWFMAIACYMRGLTYFRGFNYMRFFVRMVIEVTKDVSSFIVILAYTTFSFAVLYGIANELDMNEAWTLSYELNMGNFDNKGYNLLQWVTFLLATLVNCIVMLNLLISILGDAYKRIQEKAVEADVIEMLTNIIELESLMIWKRRTGSDLFLQKCDSVDDADKDLLLEEKIQDIQKKTNQIYKRLIKTTTEISKPEEAKVIRPKKQNFNGFMSSQKFYANRPIPNTEYSKQRTNTEYNRQIAGSPDLSPIKSDPFNEHIKKEIQTQIKLLEVHNQKSITDLEFRLESKFQNLLDSFEKRLIGSLNRI